MTSQRKEYGRREYMLELAKEAKHILSSETELLEPSEHISSFWSSKIEFLENNPFFSHDQAWQDDEQRIDLMALVVLDDFPAETLNDILRANMDVTDEPYLWLADTHDTLPDYDPANPAEGNRGAVDSDWRSPFIGSSVEEVAGFIQAVPKPPKPLCKRFFAVLQKHRYEDKKQALIYRIPEDAAGSQSEGKLESVPCPAHLVSLFFVSYMRDHWYQALRDQAFYYGEGAQWSDDSPETQVMALVVLDELPIDTINNILDANFEDSHSAHLWLADTYDSLPDYRPNYRVHGTATPIDPSWQSPFICKSIADAANFIRNTPKPPKPLCKEFFPVLQKDRFERSGKLLICKILPEGGEDDMDENEESGTEEFRKAGRSLMCRETSDEQLHEGSSDVEFEVQMIEMDHQLVGAFFSAFDRDTWWEFGDRNYG